MSLFLIGIIEMVIISMWTHFVSNNRVIASGITNFVNILIWYYVLQSVMEDINNLSLVLLYALGCAIGTVLTTSYFRLKKYD